MRRVKRSNADKTKRGLLLQQGIRPVGAYTVVIPYRLSKRKEQMFGEFVSHNSQDCPREA